MSLLRYIRGQNIRNTSVQYSTIFNHDLNAKIYTRVKKNKYSIIIKSVRHHFLWFELNSTSATYKVDTVIYVYSVIHMPMYLHFVHCVSVSLPGVSAGRGHCFGRCSVAPALCSCSADGSPGSSVPPLQHTHTPHSLCGSAAPLIHAQRTHTK